MLKYDLLTPYGEQFDKASPLPEYPRPLLARESYINLNGVWNCSIRKSNGGSIFDGEITVPYPAESFLSGVGKTLKKGEYLVYSREFEVESSFLRDITLLHIGAADNICSVDLNGVALGTHESGYLPAEFDASAAIRCGRNTLTIRVYDGTNADYPIGKQRVRRGGIWYTPVSGIWQTVWLESVNSSYIKGIRTTPDALTGTLTLKIDCTEECDITVTDGDSHVTFGKTCNGEISLSLGADKIKLWSPDEPFLYGLIIENKSDKVTSYFAFRTFTSENGRFYLNGKPIFVNGVLDQGYFSDGIYTPASYKAFSDDIMKMKELGFNALRKHIKIEPQIFYYYCDKLGMLVLQDMVNVGKYSFFKDTILPFSGLCTKRPYVNVNERQKKRFTEHATATLALLHGHPSVVYYTVFNEGWGQFDGDGLYRLLKSLDPTRLYDATSGWFREKLSDVASLHIYFKPITLRRDDRTVIVSEFGGYSYSCEGHVFNTGKSFGYRKYTSREEFENGFAALYETEILGNIPNGLAGAVYTQLSDVEDEINGILTYDRRVCKLTVKRIRDIMDRIANAVL